MTSLSALPLLVRRALRQHATASALCVLLIALAYGGFLAAWTVRGEAARAFSQSAGGFDAVLGARGSPLQLVLCALFHLEPAPGSLEAADVEDLRQHPAVAHAIPIAVGDNYRGWRLVGAPVELFTDVDWLPGKKLSVQPGGRLFDPAREEAVAGAFAAKRLGLKPGDRIQAFHGLDYNPANAHDEFFTVTGILEPTGTPADRAIWVPLADLQHLPGHDPAKAEAVSAVLVQFRPTMRAAGFALDRLYNRQGTRLTFAWPVAAVLAGLFDRFAWMDRVLGLGAAAAAALASLCVLIALHSSLHARRREWAILRAMGAPRRLLTTALVVEAGAIGALGAILGTGVFWIAGLVIAAVVRTQTGVLLDLAAWHPVLGWAPASMIALCLAAGAWPAASAYANPVAENLTPPT